MPNYRRLFVPGGTYFFTVALIERHCRMLVDQADTLRAAFSRVAKRHLFETAEICILPDHLHCLWRLPPDDQDFPLRWRLIKTAFSPSPPRDADPQKGRRKGERGVLRRRCRERLNRDDDDFSANVAYVHWDSVKHGLVKHPDDWPNSTWRRWTREYGRPHMTPPEE